MKKLRIVLEKLGILRKKSVFDTVSYHLHEIQKILNGKNYKNIYFYDFKDLVDKCLKENNADIYKDKSFFKVENFLYKKKFDKNFQKKFKFLFEGVKKRQEEEVEENKELFLREDKIKETEQYIEFINTKGEIGKKCFVHSLCLFEMFGEFIEYNGTNKKIDAKEVFPKFLDKGLESVHFDEKSGLYIIKNNEGYIFFNMYRDINTNAKNISFVYFITNDYIIHPIDGIFENMHLFTELFEKAKTEYLKK